LVHHVKSCREIGVAASTVNNDLIWIHRVLSYRSSVQHLNQPQIDLGIVSEARVECSVDGCQIPRNSGGRAFLD
jgi:hypothetical protein